MKIKKIIIENIRCFKHLEIDLSNKESISDWVVFLGNNGVGKTTLMRCIALCLCEESGAAGLLDELHGDWIRKEAPDKKAKIRIEFEKLNGNGKTPFIETIIKLSKFGEVEVSQTIEPKGPKIWNELFVCAYGANRRQYGTVSYSEYTVVDAVYSLFNYESELQNAELIIRRLQLEIDLKELFKKLEDILLLEKNSIKLERNGFSIKGPWGSYIPIGAISDGYSATIAWIMDMYGWKMLYEKSGMKDVNITGIVILDEIEQHLHPLWQKEVINRLSRQFKNIQFFISTHSPIVAINTLKTRHDDPDSKLFHIGWNDGIKEPDSSISEVQEPVNELEYNQLLESEAFGHILNTNSKVEELLKEMSELASIDKPTKKQKEVLETIKKELKPLIFPEGKTLIEREVEREYYKELEAKADYLSKILSKIK